MDGWMDGLLAWLGLVSRGKEGGCMGNAHAVS